MGPSTQWDVDLEEDGKDEMQHGLVSVPFVNHESDSNSDSDTPIDGPRAFKVHTTDGCRGPINGTKSSMLI